MSNQFKGFRNKKQTVKTAKGRKLSSTNWLNRHLNDEYVIKAHEEGYRSRAAYKLIQIDEKYKLLKSARTIIDLGCAPGGWLQVIQSRAKDDAYIIGIDLQEVKDIAKVTLIKGDFFESEAILASHLNGQKCDLIVSDMAANATGNQELNHLKNIALVETAVDFCNLHLKKGGNFVAKILRGKDEAQLIASLRKRFQKVHQFKPDSSYSDSSEIYYICLQFI
jgi:23S rRNA (uridine2552-2'-O)-methyltransferase